MGEVIERHINLVEDLVKGLRECKTILDLGTAKGGKLDKVCQRLGARGIGIEINPHYVKNARQNERVEVRQGDARDFDKVFDPKSFDGIMCVDVLEHIAHSVAEAKELIQRMKKVARKSITMCIPLERNPRRSDGVFMDHNSIYELSDVVDLFDGEATIILDKSFHERLASKRGEEYRKDLLKNVHHGTWPQWTVCSLRLDT